MTEHEAVELSQIFFANLISVYAVFLTIITGYLVIAYIVGSSLKLGQVSIINGIFLSGTVWTTWAGFAYLMSGSYYAVVGGSMNPERVVYAGPLTGYISLIINTCIIIACFKFMWDVRHPKPD